MREYELRQVGMKEKTMYIIKEWENVKMIT